MSISNRKVYKKSPYLTEKSIRKVNISPKSLYEMYIYIYITEKSISNRNVYNMSLYLIEMSISNRNVYMKCLYLTENSIRRVYI